MYIHEKDKFIYSPDNEAPNNARIDIRAFEAYEKVKVKGKFTASITMMGQIYNI